MSTLELGALSTNFVYAAMAAYAVALVAYAADLSALRDRGPLGRRRRGAAIGGRTTVLGAVFHVLAVVLRGLAAGRVPWANMYEFTIVFSLVAVLAYLFVLRGRDVRYLGALVVGPALLALGLAVTVFFVAADGVQPALQSYWLVVHVSVATISVGILSVAAAFSVLQLVRMRRPPEGPEDAEMTDDLPEPDAAALEGAGPGSTAQAVAAPPRAGRLLSEQARSRLRLAALPPAEELERLAYRFNAVGFVLWTFTLVAGAIWAEAAWGRYWGWDAKEVWTFVVWVVYAAYLHARSTRGWSGRRAAWFSLTGYTCVLLNFFAVNLAFTSLHSYSGL